MTEQLIAEPTEVAAEPLPTGPIRVSWAPVPKVNLLPIEILESRRFRRTQVVLGGAVLLTVLVGAAGTIWAQHGVSHANDQLLSSQARVSTLQAQETQFSKVPEVISQVDAADTARSLALGDDVLWYRFINDLDGARPDGVVVNAITVALTSTATPGTASGNPLVPSGLGTLTISGTALEYSQISSWLEAVNKITGFSASTLSNATKTPDGLTFSSGATIDSDALSGRYNKEAG